MKKKIKVTLIKSQIGLTQKQKATVRGLGLGRIGATRTLENTPAVRGMIKGVIHMVSFVEVN